jgi:hypothetical protein
MRLMARVSVRITQCYQKEFYVTRRINPIRSAAIRAATTEAGATQYRRSIGDRIAATVAGLVELLAGLVLTILLVIAVLFGAAALGEALGSPLYHGWPSPRAAIPGCVLGGAAMLRGLHRLLRGFRRIDSLAWPSIGYTLIWLYAGCGLSLGGLWVAYSCVCDDPGASIGAPLLSFQ